MRHRGPAQTSPELILSISVPTPIGRVWLAARSRGLVRIELPGPNAELRMNVWLALHFPMASKRTGVSPILKKACAEIEAYFMADLTKFSVPYELVGTPFQLAVWRSVAAIPFGDTVSYRDVATWIDNPRAVRAVGNAQSANPLPIVIPCHRVIGTNGSLTGYAGGVEIKQWLLDHEAARQQRAPSPPRVLHLASVSQASERARRHNPPAPAEPSAHPPGTN